MTSLKKLMTGKRDRLDSSWGSCDGTETELLLQETNAIWEVLEAIIDKLEEK